MGGVLSVVIMKALRKKKYNEFRLETLAEKKE